MSESYETEKTEESPLLKQKKPRPPQSQKQQEAFQRAAAKRAENVKLRKDQKILEAQKALLQKEGIMKPEIKEKQNEVQFKIEEEEEEEKPAPQIKLPSKKKPEPKHDPKPEPKQIIKKPPKQKKEPQIIIESDSDNTLKDYNWLKDLVEMLESGENPEHFLNIQNFSYFRIRFFALHPKALLFVCQQTQRLEILLMLCILKLETNALDVKLMERNLRYKVFFKMVMKFKL